MSRNGIPRRRRAPVSERFWPKVDLSGECWVWTGAVDKHGYGQIACGGKFGGQAKAHRVGYELQCGPIPSGRHVLHHCDNPKCVRGSHLFLGDQADNMRDMWAKGRGRCDGGGRLGSANGNHRLTEEQVSEILRRHRAGEPSRKLGKEFGVSKTLVLFISSGKVWPHITRAAS